MRPSQKKLCTGQNDSEPDDAEDEIEVKCGGGERPADSRRTKVRHRGPGECKKRNERNLSKGDFRGLAVRCKASHQDNFKG